MILFLFLLSATRLPGQTFDPAFFSAQVGFIPDCLDQADGVVLFERSRIYSQSKRHYAG
jgi:hypothetical protein